MYKKEKYLNDILSLIFHLFRKLSNIILLFLLYYCSCSFPIIFYVIFSKILYPFVSRKRLSQTTAKVAIKRTIFQFVLYTKICNIRMLTELSVSGFPSGCIHCHELTAQDAIFVLRNDNKCLIKNFFVFGITFTFQTRINMYSLILEKNFRICESIT